MQLNQTQFYVLVYVLLVALSGAGEFLHVVPGGTFGSMLFAVAGHALGVFSPPPVPTDSTSKGTP